MVKESIESLAHKRYLRSTKVKTQISRENGHKRPAPVTDSAISNTTKREDLIDLIWEEMNGNL